MFIDQVLRAIRKKADLTLDKISAKTGYHSSTCYHAEAAAVTPKTALLEAYADVTGLTIVYTPKVGWSIKEETNEESSDDDANSA